MYVDNVATDPQLADDERAALLAGKVTFAGVLIQKNGRRKGAFGVTARSRAPGVSRGRLDSDVAERTWAVERARAETELRERERSAPGTGSHVAVRGRGTLERIK
jgi:hypothetical protein